MSRIGSLISKAMTDGKVNRAEVEGLIKEAKANGIVSKSEKAELSRFLHRSGDRFDAEARATLASFLGLPAPAAGPTDAVQQPQPKPRVDLLDPSVLAKDAATVTYGKVQGGQLFVDGVNYDDVQQGQIADCFFVGSLAAVAYADPKLIEDAIKDNGDGTYTVRFFKKDFTGKLKAEYVQVDDDLPGGGSPRYARARDRKELWPALMEKAWATWKGGYDAMGNGGYSTEVLTALTGHRSSYYTTSGNKDYVFDLIKTAVESHTPITAGTFGQDSGVDYTGTGVYAWHNYSVVGASVDGTTKYVHLRNPWGSHEPGDDGKNDGIFKMKLDDFAKLYQGLNIN